MAVAHGMASSKGKSGGGGKQVKGVKKTTNMKASKPPKGKFGKDKDVAKVTKKHASRTKTLKGGKIPS